MHAIVLDAYAARSCPVKTFNVFDRAIPLPEAPDESLGKPSTAASFSKLRCWTPSPPQPK